MHRVLRFTGLAAVVVIWTALTVATAVGDFDLLGKDPLSYLGTRSPSAALFTIGLATAAVLLTAFHGYVRSRYPVAGGFSLAMLAGLAGQMVAAFVPIGGDPAVHRIHTTCALVLGLSLPLLMWRFAAGQPPGRWRRLSYRLFWAEVAACGAGLYLSARMVAPVAEILPASVFHAWVFTLTFANRSARRHPARSRPVERRLESGHQAGRSDADADLADADGHGRERVEACPAVVVGQGEQVEERTRMPHHQRPALK